MPLMRCTLGSDDAFWASCNDTYRWYYIPKRAEEKLQAGRDPDLSDFPAKVKLVALGYGHSYFIAFEDRTSSWKVKSNYKALDEVFDEEKKKAERVVVSHSITSNCFFCTRRPAVRSARLGAFQQISRRAQLKAKSEAPGWS
jgi:hypothetical protein